MTNHDHTMLRENLERLGGGSDSSGGGRSVPSDDTQWLAPGGET